MLGLSGARGRCAGALWIAALGGACSTAPTPRDAGGDVAPLDATIDGSRADGATEGGGDTGSTDADPDARSNAASCGGDAGADAQGPAPVPRIEGAWWDVARTPDLGALNGTNQQPVDFGVWQSADGSWHLWSCIRGTQEPGFGRLFYHWQGASLTASDWTPVGVAMHADTTLGEYPGGLQAPFVLRDGALYRMFYGDWEDICEATSADGVAFTRLAGTGGRPQLFSEGSDSNTRDPMVLRVGDHYNVYYTAWVGGRAGVWARSTTDLVTFGAPRLVSIGGVAGAGGTDAECPFVVHREDTGYYYLFRTQHYGADAQTTVYRSCDPLDFGLDDDRYRVGTLPVAAPELLEVGGQTYIAALRGGLDGIRIARVAWVPAGP